MNSIDQLVGELKKASYASDISGLIVSILHAAGSPNHPLAEIVRVEQDDRNMQSHRRTLLALHASGALGDLKSRVAAEIDDEYLDVAETQLNKAKSGAGNTQFYLAVAAFLIGAVLEDSLRRICDRLGRAYSEPSSISGLAGELYKPKAGMEDISRKENKDIIAWAETRNTADHGRWADLKVSDVDAMLIGARGFVAKHLR